MNFNILAPLNSIYATCTASPTAATGFPVANLFEDSRIDTFKTASAVTSVTFDFDFGTAKLIDSVYLGRANLCSIAAGGNITLNVKADSNSIFSSADLDSSLVFNAATLSNMGGSNFSDVFHSFTLTSARYWRVTLSAGSAIVFEFSKLFLGALFDLGHEPIAPVETTVVVNTPNARRPTVKTVFNFEGVSDAKKEAFNNSVDVFCDFQPVILFFLTYDEILNGTGFKFGFLENIKSSLKTINSNNISFTFIEAQ